MERIHIEASTAYDVIIEDGVLQHIIEYIKPLKGPCPTMLVSDDQVAPHYAALVKSNSPQRAIRYMNTYSLMVKQKKMLPDYWI